MRASEDESERALLVKYKKYANGSCESQVLAPYSFFSFSCFSAFSCGRAAGCNIQRAAGVHLLSMVGVVLVHLLLKFDDVLGHFLSIIGVVLQVVNNMTCSQYGQDNAFDVGLYAIDICCWVLMLRPMMMLPI